MNKRFLLLLLALAGPAHAQSAHPNVLVSAQNRPEETAIAINPKNTNELVAGANINNQYFSLDAGRTWTARTLASPHGVWGDPCIVADTTGAFYFFHLSNPRPNPNPPGSVAFPFIDRLQVQRAASAGAPFALRSFFALRPPKQQDKLWATVDRRTNVIHATWTEFDAYGSPAPGDSSRILYSRSADQGLTWSAPQNIGRQGDAVDESSTVEGATPAIGPAGEVYVAWAGPRGLVCNRSLDGGLTWPLRERPVAAQPGGWAFPISGLDRGNGLPITACDLSRGPNRGTLYVNWADQRNGPNDTDVWLSRSLDGGLSWSPARRVNNDPPGRQQFFTWMTVDQATGYLWLVWYDRRNYPDDRTDVYGARSTDGGLTFQNFRYSQTPFTPISSVFFGDYINITAHNNVVRPLWMRMDGTQTSVWTALTDVTVLAAAAPAAGAGFALQAYPSPAAGVLHVALQLPAPAAVGFRLRALTGQTVRTATPGALRGGAHDLTLSVAGLAAGVYVLETRVGDELHHQKVAVGE